MTDDRIAVLGGARTPIGDFGGALKDVPVHGVHMGVTAENVAARYGVSRPEQDEFALRSQQRADSVAARAAFAEEITPVEVRGRRVVTVVSQDEHPRPGTTAEGLAALPLAFREGGTVTAVVTSAMEPELMAYAPVLALRKLFQQTGTGPSDTGTVELNEAFAAQAVAVIRDAKLDLESVNPYGGAIALGHPVGATGAILALRVVQDLVRRDLELGVVSMCIGGGQALAALFRRVR
jgi:acetyl-CoA C-acetyltransferase